MKILKWEVIEWNKIWRELWFPTANIQVKKNLIEEWTYQVNIIIDEKLFYWAWSYLKNKWVFEVHIFEFSEDIYWEDIEIIIIEKIRDNISFENLEKLKNQIKNDIKFIKNNIIPVLTFWTFDLLHPGHEYYLNNAKKYWNKLITIISTDKNVFKFKNKYPENNEENRKKSLEKLWISDIIEIWKWEDPMKRVNKYIPKVICLWYDQKWFTHILEKYISDNNLNIEIIRIKPYKENIYKSSILKNSNK